jgi:hypothetical protein
MMRKIIYLLISLFIILALFALWYIYPKQVNKTFDGVLYQIGNDDKDIENVSIKVEGKLKKTPFGSKVFRGKIQINNEVLPTPKSDQEYIEINFGFAGEGGVIQNWEYNENPLTSIGLYSYGILYIDDKFNELTIAKYDNPREQNGVMWNGEDGYVISAPTSTRSEALEMTNRLMKSFLREPLK